MYCPNCGAQNNEGANNCTNCGASLPNNTQQANPVNNGGEPKSKLIAGLLAILVGSLGIHDFYLGNNKNGIIKLCLTLLGCGIGALVAGVWAIIEGVQILTGKITTDAAGVPLKD